MISLKEILDYNVILASKSPRRLQLIEQMGFRVQTRVKEIEESFPSYIILNTIPEYLAKKKAAAYSYEEINDNEILITADTMVFIGDNPMGKPKNKEEAITFLEELSNAKHRVITGCCIKTNKKERSFCVSSDVYFRKLSKEEIEFYVENFSPYDKAGAYGIQEWIGCIGIEKIEGSFYNVMGLPTQRLFLEIRNLLNN